MDTQDNTKQTAPEQPTLDELLDKLPEIRSKITADFMGHRPTALMVDIADLDTLLAIIDKLNAERNLLKIEMALTDGMIRIAGQPDGADLLRAINEGLTAAKRRVDEDAAASNGDGEARDE